MKGVILYSNWTVKESWSRPGRPHYPREKVPFIFSLHARKKYGFQVHMVFWKVDVKARKILPSTINEDIQRYSRYILGRYAFDKDSNIWQLSTEPVGILKYDLDKSKIKFYPLEEFAEVDINYGLSFYKDKVVFTVIDEGVFFFDPSSSSIERIVVPDSITHSGQFSVAEIASSGNRIWLGDFNNGVILMEEDENGFNFERIAMDEGLPINRIYCLKMDHFGDVWGFTQAGLFRINKDKEVKSFYRKDGLLNDHLGVLGRPYGLIKEDGSVFLQESGFYTYFYPDHVTVNSEPPNARLESMTIGDSIIYNNIAFKESIELDPGQDYFNIKYSCDNLIDPEENEYKYRLKGQGQRWTYTKSNMASYINMPPGEYVFELFAANNDGVWSESPALLNIELKPFFWQMWWFKLACLLAFLGIVYLMYRNRLSGIRREEKIKRDFESQLVDKEMKALRAQMNPHFMFNSLNSIKSFIARNEPRNATKLFIEVCPINALDFVQ